MCARVFTTNEQMKITRHSKLQQKQKKQKKHRKRFFAFVFYAHTILDGADLIPAPAFDWCACLRIYTTDTYRCIQVQFYGEITSATSSNAYQQIEKKHKHMHTENVDQHSICSKIENSKRCI